VQNRLLFVLGLLTIAAPAFAESTTNTAAVPVTTGASEATTEVARPSLMDNFYINYFGIYHGPAINNLSSPYTLSRKGLKNTKSLSDGTNNMGFDSELTFAYMLTKDIGIGPYIQFYAFPVQGYGITMGDVGIKLFDKHFIHTSSLNVYANTIVEAPVNYDKQRGVDLKIKMTPNFRYNFNATRFSVGMWTEQTMYIGASNKIPDNKAFKLNFLPYVNYQLAPKLAASLTYEYETDHVAGKNNLDFKMFQTDIMPGFVYMITPKVLVNPYLQFFTTEKLAMDRTGLGAVISASL
jgi:hypothetical protein